jgi:hypothetical protein
VILRVNDIETIASERDLVGLTFQIKSIGEIMDEADYPGIRVSMVTKFDGAIIPFKVDISTGDIITPKEVRYQFKLMLEDRAVDIWTYNLETIMAEKFEMGLFWFIIVVCTSYNKFKHKVFS